MINQIREKYIKNPLSLSTAFWKYEHWFTNANAKIIQIGSEEVLTLGDQIISYSGTELLSFDYHKYRGINTLEKYDLDGYKENAFFVLYHDLVNINNIDHDYEFRNVKESEAKEVMTFINNSYEFISVKEQEVLNWRSEHVFDASLWIWMIENNNKIALGIAEWDKKINAGALEWIQVHESSRGKRVGQILVNELLTRMAGVNFVTVSGEVDNISRPEKLYLKCGFIGDKIWYYYKK